MKPYLLRPPRLDKGSVVYGWRLSSDGKDTFMLERGSLKKDGKKYTDVQTWSDPLYYTTITAALKAAVSRLVASGRQEMHREVADALYAVSKALREISEEVEGRAIKLEVSL